MQIFFRRSIFYIGLLVISALSAPACAQFTRQEVIAFESAVISAEDFLMGKKDLPVTIAGYLRIAKRNEKNPVVILFHDAGGLGSSGGQQHEWARVLNEAGIATFAVDSFAGRGIKTQAEAARMPRITRVMDAYRALELLAKHPLIDPNKIAIMGFSHGGVAALYASMLRFQKMHGNANNQFAAYIPVYGLCETTYRGDEALAAQPVLLLRGTADDGVPIEPCRAYVARLTKAGMNARLIEYPDAQHTFDAPGLREPVKRPQATTLRKCRLAEAEKGAEELFPPAPQPPSQSALNEWVLRGVAP